MTERWFNDCATDAERLAQESEEVQIAEEFDAWRHECGLDLPLEGDEWEEFLRSKWEENHPQHVQYDGPEEDDIAF